MNAIQKIGVVAVWTVVLARLALPQFDAAAFVSNLRTKYGPPLSREIFTVRPGLEMTVDYAANGNVCRIQLPPVGPGKDSRVSGPQAIDEFVSELVPLAARGREVSRFVQAVGAPSTSSIIYENVIIFQSFQGEMRTGVGVTFSKETCRDRPAR